MRIAIATDHAGFSLKESLAKNLKESGHEIIDCGAFTLDVNDDYPVFCVEASRKLSNKEVDRAILIGGSGQGEAIVANRFKNVRCAVFYGAKSEIPALSREHNDSNALSLGARFISEEDAKTAVLSWISTPFSGDDRHVRRINQIDNINI